MEDEHLPVAAAARADSDGRNRERLRDARRHLRGDRLEDDREAAGSLERPRVLQERPRLFRRAALRAEPAEHRRGLRRQPDMAHDGDAGAHEGEHARERRARAFELDRVRPCFLHEADAVPNGILVGHLERAERHVGDDERALGSARSRAREHEHLVHRGRNRRLVAEDGHRGRVADEDDVDPGGVGDAPARVVVRRHHHDRLSAALHARRAR